jgi:hypothetical protein
METTTAEHAEAWAREQGIEVPERSSPEFADLMERWADWAFSPAERPAVSEVYRVRRGGLEEVYLGRKGQWTTWQAAARFSTQEAAEEFAAAHNLVDYGIF